MERAGCRGFRHRHASVHRRVASAPTRWSVDRGGLSRCGAGRGGDHVLPPSSDDASISKPLRLSPFPIQAAQRRPWGVRSMPMTMVPGRLAAPSSCPSDRAGPSATYTERFAIQRNPRHDGVPRARFGFIRNCDQAADGPSGHGTVSPRDGEGDSRERSRRACWETPRHTVPRLASAALLPRCGRASSRSTLR